MRITFGIHQGKTVKSLATDKLQSFSDWLDENPLKKDAQPKWRLERAQLRNAIDRELGGRADEAADDENEYDFNNGPIPLAKFLLAGETRAFLGLLYLLEKNEGLQPFPATFEAQREIFGGSNRAWSSMREKLMTFGYLVETSRGMVAFRDPSMSTTVTSYHGKPLFLLLTFVGESKDTTSLPGTVSERYRAIDEALEILGIKNKIDQAFKDAANKLLKKLLNADTRGYTVRDVKIVAEWGRRMYDTGEERWHKMVDLLYLWNPTNFHAHLTAAHSAPAKKPGFSVIEDPIQRAAYAEEAKEKIRKITERMRS